MSHVLGRILRFPLDALNAARGRPWLSLSIVLLLAAAAGAGFWGYAAHQWRSAKEDVRHERLDEAAGRLDFCLAVWPRSPEVHLLAARLARLKGDFVAAEHHLTTCKQLQGGATEAVQLEFYLMRAQAGEMDELGELLTETARAGHPEAPAILETLARAYIARHRYKPAHGALSLLIDLHPEHARAYQWRGWVRERLNNPKAALEDYTRALELAPDLVPPRLRVAEMLLEDKQAPEALPHLERLARQESGNPQVQARLGMCRFLMGEFGEARRLMEAAVGQLPADGPLLIALANLDLQEGRGADAEVRLRAALAADPSETEALFVLASALQLQNRTDEAAAVLAEHKRKAAVVERINTLLKEKADSPAATADDLAEIGELMFQIGRDTVGVYWSDRALEKNPTNQRAHRALAAYYERKGDAANAEVHRRQVRRAPEPGK